MPEIVDIQTPDPIMVDERTLRFTASKEIYDRSDDIIRINGMEFEDYDKNPTFLFCHKDFQLPVGKVVRRETTGDELLVDVEFDEDEFSQLVFDKYKSGSMNAVSISFMPGDVRDLDEGGFEFETSKIVEISAVPVPDNPEALVHREGKSLGSDVYELMIGKAIDSDSTRVTKEIGTDEETRRFTDKRIDKAFEIETASADEGKGTDAEEKSTDSVEKGARLGQFLQLIVESSLDEDEPKSTIYEEIADASNKSASTIRSVFSGETKCPTEETIDGIVSVLPVSKSQILRMAEFDGCDYDTEENDISAETEEKSVIRTIEVNVDLGDSVEKINKAVDKIGEYQDALTNAVDMDGDREGDTDTEQEQDEDIIEFEITS